MVTNGLQFKAAFLRAAPPTMLEGIERYLGSGMIKGIGPVYTKKLVQVFAEGVFDTIEQSPERLREVDEIRAEACRAAELLGIPAEIVDAALDLELSDGEVVADTVEGRPCVFLAGLYRAEESIAERLIGLGAGRPPWLALDPEKAIPWVERKVGISLAESQKEAVRLALRTKLLVFTGGPGVGKTTLVNAILKVLQAKTPAIALAAPTAGRPSG